MELRVLSINTSGHLAFAVIVTKHESLIRIDSVNSTVFEFNVRCCGASKNQHSDHRLSLQGISVVIFFENFCLTRALEFFLLKLGTEIIDLV
jgi:hypothetical protein